MHLFSVSLCCLVRASFGQDVVFLSADLTLASNQTCPREELRSLLHTDAVKDVACQLLNNSKWRLGFVVAAPMQHPVTNLLNHSLLDDLSLLGVSPAARPTLVLHTPACNWDDQTFQWGDCRCHVRTTQCSAFRTPVPQTHGWKPHLCKFHFVWVLLVVSSLLLCVCGCRCVLLLCPQLTPASQGVVPQRSRRPRYK